MARTKTTKRRIAPEHRRINQRAVTFRDRSKSYKGSRGRDRSRAIREG